MLQASCRVVGGNSGGSIVCARTGRAFGLVVSNVRHHAATDDDGGGVIPSVSLAIPAPVLAPLVRALQAVRGPLAPAQLAALVGRFETDDPRIADLFALRDASVDHDSAAEAHGQRVLQRMYESVPQLAKL
jgi:hypothetical protein